MKKYVKLAKTYILRSIYNILSALYVIKKSSLFFLIIQSKILSVNCSVRLNMKKWQTFKHTHKLSLSYNYCDITHTLDNVIKQIRHLLPASSETIPSVVDWFTFGTRCRAVQLDWCQIKSTAIKSYTSDPLDIVNISNLLSSIRLL